MTIKFILILFLAWREVLPLSYRPRRPLRGEYLGTRWGWVVSTTPRPLCPRERPGTHCTGVWVGLGAGLDRCGKSRPPPGFDPRTFQPVASRYTDYATSAPLNYLFCIFFFFSSSCSPVCVSLSCLVPPFRFNFYLSRFLPRSSLIVLLFLSLYLIYALVALFVVLCSPCKRCHVAVVMYCV